MRIVVISDTHGRHRELGNLSGDVLVHAGDIEMLFERDMGRFYLDDIDDWFAEQHFDRIFCIGGNHDFALERRVVDGHQPFRNATWLHERAETFAGVTFYGASWVPMLRQLPFYADAESLSAAWSRIPDSVDVLVTHTPPHGILDVSGSGKVLGCHGLADRLKMLTPALHCFGHVHNSAGHRKISGTNYVNATSVNSDFQIAHTPFLFDLPDRA